LMPSMLQWQNRMGERIFIFQRKAQPESVMVKSAKM
jgi:hypothetical protein